MLTWLVALLAVLAFLQAVILFPRLVPGRRTGDEVLVGDVNLPMREVRVLVSPGPPALLLKTPLDLPEADRLSGADLDSRLFPGGERHRYYLLIVHNGGEEEVVLDLVETPLLLEIDEGGSVAPVDLAAAISENGEDLPDYLSLEMRVWVPSEPVVRLPPGSRRRILLAYPEAAAPERLVSGKMGDLTLDPRTLTKDDLDRTLESPWGLLRAKRP